MKVPVRMSVNTVPLPCRRQYFNTLRPRRFRYIENFDLEGGLRVLGNAGLEAVLEATRDILEVPCSASADGLSALGLLTPVVYNHHISSEYVNKHIAGCCIFLLP